MRCGRCVVCVFCCGWRVWSVGADWRVQSRAFGVLGRGGVGFVEWEGDGAADRVGGVGGLKA